MKSLHETISWQVTLLTPLHIGDGVEMQENLDYISGQAGLQVVNLEEMLEAVASVNHQAIGEMGRQNFDLPRFLRDYGVSLKPSYTLPLATGATVKSLRRFLKNGLGQPYVPGSSLKGALRTALLAPLLAAGAAQHTATSPRTHGDLQNALKASAGPDPNHDLFRPLQVSDSAGLEAQDVLGAEEIKFFNIAEGDKGGWKDFSSRRTVSRFDSAAGIYVEALKSGAVFHVQAALDGFLGQPAIRRGLGYSGESGFETFSALARTINSHSRSLAEREREFFKGYGVSPAAVFLGTVIERFATLSGDSFILRLAWGSGWKGMTGDWIHGHELDSLRKHRNLGKTGCPRCQSPKTQGRGREPLVCGSCSHTYRSNERWLFPTFPKTRRLALKDGFPCLPLGWVEVKPIGREVFAQKSLAGSARVLSHHKGESISLAEEDSTEGARNGFPPSQAGQKTVDPAVMKRQKLEIFQQSLGATKNLAGEMNQFLDQIKTADDMELKGEMARLLLKKAQALPKKKYSKSLAEGKKWAQSLNSLCQELKLTS